VDGWPTTKKQVFAQKLEIACPNISALAETLMRLYAENGSVKLTNVYQLWVHIGQALAKVFYNHPKLLDCDLPYPESAEYKRQRIQQIQSTITQSLMLHVPTPEEQSPTQTRQSTDYLALLKHPTHFPYPPPVTAAPISRLSRFINYVNPIAPSRESSFYGMSSLPPIRNKFVVAPPQSSSRFYSDFSRNQQHQNLPRQARQQWPRSSSRYSSGLMEEDPEYEEEEEEEEQAEHTYEEEPQDEEEYEQPGNSHDYRREKEQYRSKKYKTTHEGEELEEESDDEKEEKYSDDGRAEGEPLKLRKYQKEERILTSHKHRHEDGEKEHTAQGSESHHHHRRHHDKSHRHRHHGHHDRRHGSHQDPKHETRQKEESHRKIKNKYEDTMTMKETDFYGITPEHGQDPLEKYQKSKLYPEYNSGTSRLAEAALAQQQLKQVTTNQQNQIQQQEEEQEGEEDREDQRIRSKYGMGPNDNLRVAARSGTRYIVRGAPVPE